MKNKEIEKIAINWVCPLNGKPTTPYEINEVKRLVRFAEDVIIAIGKTDHPLDRNLIQDKYYDSV